jgi:hypothetical protein
MVLARICPEYLPPLVATRCDWRAWITVEAGVPLDCNPSVEFLEHAVAAMGKLQQTTARHIDELLGAGAADQRMRVLGGHVYELVEYLEEAMSRQTSTKVMPIGAARLREIGRIVENACTAMDHLAIPDAIIHNDINSGNILIRKGACVFIDWCEAYVGNPFLTLQHLLLLLRGSNCAERNVVRLKDAYRQCWLESLNEWQIDNAFALAPLLAAASYLYGRGDWLHTGKRNDPHVQSYARSLARYMDREAQNPVLLEAICA